MTFLPIWLKAKNSIPENKRFLVADHPGAALGAGHILGIPDRQAFFLLAGGAFTNAVFSFAPVKTIIGLDQDVMELLAVAATTT